MEFTSLRNLAIFFVDGNTELPDPEIGIDPDGFLLAEWCRSNAATSMEFLPDGSIVFVATMTVDGQEGSQDIHGTGGREHALQTVRPFINQFQE